MRQRAMLVQYGAQHIQHIQKALQQMNVKLDKVLSDITGKTGLAILEAILAGERDPLKLAQLRHVQCKNDEATIAKALQGNWRDEHLFALRQALELYKTYRQQIADCDRQIEAHLESFASKSEEPLPPAPKGRKPSRNQLKFEAGPSILRITGVDLTKIDGIDDHTAL
jgi:hypothetical protein